jgi:hypothetical protein
LPTLQIPTVVLFAGGQEVKRLPPFRGTKRELGNVTKTKLRFKNVASFFDLEQHAPKSSER